METFQGHRRPCYFYQRGYCKRGKNCKFAHHQVLKPPGYFDIRRRSSNTSSFVPLTPFPGTEEPEKGFDWIAQESVLSRNTLALLKREESPECEKNAAEDRWKESSGNVCETRQSLPDSHVDDTEQGVPKSSQDNQDSQSTESDRSVKRLVIVPVTLCLLVPDMTGLTEQHAAKRRALQESIAKDLRLLHTSYANPSRYPQMNSTSRACKETSSRKPRYRHTNTCSPLFIKCLSLKKNWSS